MEQSKEKRAGRAIRGVAAVAALGVPLTLAACSSGGGGSGSPGQSDRGTGAPLPMATAGGPAGANGGVTGGADPHAADNPNISQRQINYGEALRTASLQLVGELPPLADIQAIAPAGKGAVPEGAERAADGGPPP